jgi:hypothetical protein
MYWRLDFRYLVCTDSVPRVSLLYVYISGYFCLQMAAVDGGQDMYSVLQGKCF